MSRLTYLDPNFFYLNFNLLLYKILVSYVKTLYVFKGHFAHLHAIQTFNVYISFSSAIQFYFLNVEFPTLDRHWTLSKVGTSCLHIILPQEVTSGNHFNVGDVWLSFKTYVHIFWGHFGRKVSVCPVNGHHISECENILKKTYTRKKQKWSNDT